MILSVTAVVLLTGIAGCASADEDNEKSDAGTPAQLEAKAKISKAEAEQIALAKVPNGTIKEGELEKEKGKLIWSFDMSTPDTKDTTEVNVNAITGHLVSMEWETPADQAREGDEDGDKDKDSGEKKGEDKD